MATQITPELLNAVMAKQGAPNTTDNLNRIAEFAALHPGILEQYIGKGTDAGMTGASIDNSIAAADGVAPRGPADPNGYISTLDPNTGMTSTGPRLTKTPEPTGGGRRAGPPNAGKRGGSAVVDPSLTGIPVGGTTPPAGGGDDGLGVPWWLAPFAVRALQKPKPQLPPPFVQEPRGGLPAHLQPGAVVPQGPDSGTPGRTQRGGVTDVNDLNARNLPGGQPRIAGPQFRDTVDADLEAMRSGQPRQLGGPMVGGQMPPTYPSGAPVIGKDQIYDATKGEVQKQVDAENERLLKEEMARQNAKPRPARPVRPGIR